MGANIVHFCQDFRCSPFWLVLSVLTLSPTSSSLSLPSPPLPHTHQAGTRLWTAGFAQVTVPVALLDAPYEMMRVPHAYAAKRFVDIVHYHTAASGGHFFAMEQPQALAVDVRSFVDAVLEREVHETRLGAEL